MMWRQSRKIKQRTSSALRGEFKMNDKYEAAEVLIVGRAQDVILGEKDVRIDDNRPGGLPLDYQDTALAVFEE
jgi:hypothetical protein